MLNSNFEWPLQRKPIKDDRVIIASEGMRIRSFECRLEDFGKSLRVECADSITFENLRIQQRVAFTLSGSDPGLAINGSAIARLVERGQGLSPWIELEPYRLQSGEGETWELKLAGWSPMAEVAPSSISAFSFWYQAFRAVTLPMSALPVAVGSTAAFFFGQFNWMYFFLALLGTVLAHAGANAAADYFDFKKGVDLAGALSSHLGALAREKVEPEMILLAALGCFLVTALVGVVLVFLAGWQLLLFGVAGVLGAFFYTGRPLSYKYRAMGELVLGVLMGPVIVMGSYYLQSHSWSWLVFLISIALGMLVSSVSLSNNLRDLPDDKAAGIRTLPMYLGIRATKNLYYFLTACPYAILVAIIFVNHNLWPLALAAASLPQAVTAIRSLLASSDDIDDIRRRSLKTPFALNSIRLYFSFAALTAFSIAVAGILN